MTSVQRISLAILAGGRSSRMGRDKAMLPYGEGDLLDHMINVANQVRHSRETLVIGDRSEYHRRGARVIADLWPGMGPLGGIATALEVSSTDRVFLLAVDMPFVSLLLLHAMAEHESEADIVVPGVPESDRTGGEARTRLHVLHAIYRKRCLPYAVRQLTTGDLKVTSIYDDVRVEILDPAWISTYDPDLRSFENVNRPEDYARVMSERRR